jgi:hypothetical protein
MQNISSRAHAPPPLWRLTPVLIAIPVSSRQFTLHTERCGGERRGKEGLARASAMFFPGRTRRSAASSAVCAAARTSAARPSTGAAASAWTSSECAAVAMKPSMWQPRSLPAHPDQRQPHLLGWAQACTLLRSPWQTKHTEHQWVPPPLHGEARGKGAHLHQVPVPQLGRVLRQRREVGDHAARRAPRQGPARLAGTRPAATRGARAGPRLFTDRHVGNAMPFSTFSPFSPFLLNTFCVALQRRAGCQHML